MSLLARLRSGSRAAPSTDPGERIYAIGDIHGCRALLREMLDRIEEHLRTLPPTAAVHVVLLGDLVDRGPDSAGVLSFVHDISRRSDRLIVLRGNHEDTMLRAIDGEPGAMHSWLRSGGYRTLESYGVPSPRDVQDEGAAARALGQAIPADILSWLRELPLSAASGDYLFVHAGIRPGVPIRRQSRQDLMWIREEFLDDTSDHGVMVVHGHTIVPDIDVRPNRIGIDVGAYRTGVMKALYLEGTQREVIVAGTPDGGRCR